MGCQRSRWIHKTCVWPLEQYMFTCCHSDFKINWHLEGQTLLWLAEAYQTISQPHGSHSSRSEVWTLIYHFNGCSLRWLAFSTVVKSFPSPRVKSCHLRSSFCSKLSPGGLNLSASAAAALRRSLSRLSSQGGCNTLHLTRRWELHPHRWILFLWPAADCPPHFQGFSIFFFFIRLLTH